MCLLLRYTANERRVKIPDAHCVYSAISCALEELIKESGAAHMVAEL